MVYFSLMAFGDRGTLEPPMVISVGFEPTTYSLIDRRSNQLSYENMRTTLQAEESNLVQSPLDTTLKGVEPLMVLW